MELLRTVNPNNNVMIIFFPSCQDGAASSQAGKQDHSQIIRRAKTANSNKKQHTICFTGGATIFFILFGLHTYTRSYVYEGYIVSS